MPIGYPRWPPWQPPWKSIFRLFSWTERPVDSKLGVTHRSKIAKIVPFVNPSWLPFRVRSNDHAQLTGIPYIFFKIKNCLNDDLFISCDDRIGKMLHNICISAVAMLLRWVTRGPWASCFNQKVLIFFLFLQKKNVLGTHLKSLTNASNEYPQHTFYGEIRKIFIRYPSYPELCTSAY